MISIKKGIIRKDGKKIGTAMKELMYGYHPAVKVTIGEKSREFGAPNPAVLWLELDEPDLVEKIKAFVKDMLAQQSKPKKDAMYSPNWLRKHGYE